MPIDNIFSLLSIGSLSRRKLSVEDAINKAMMGDVVQKPLPQIKYISAHFRLLNGDKPMPKVKLDWLDSNKKIVNVDGLFRTNESGWGMLSLEETVFRSLSSLCLVVTQNKQTIKFDDISCNAIREQRLIKGPEGYAIQFVDPSEPMLDILPERKVSRRFTLAVSGTAEQLQTSIPLLKGHACIRIKHVFVDGKSEKAIRLPGKAIKVGRVDKDMPSLLEGIDCLIDLSNNPLISKLANDQLSGNGKMKTFIFPDASRFLGREESILAYYEKPEHDITGLADILLQISRKDLEGGR